MAPQFLAVVQTASPMNSPVGSWAPVVLLLIIGFGFAFANIALSLFLGPSRTGPGKETTYESGMLPIGDARRRFNVRFYIVAMIFLVFDVEVIFFYPWATIFAKHVQADTSDNGLILLMEMITFVVILLVAYFYAWGKGVFRWD
jgi:NADH-quinone oxidoreductase subunit A